MYRFLLCHRQLSLLRKSIRPLFVRNASDHHHHPTGNESNNNLEEEEEEYTSADFNTPFWRNTFIAVTGLFVLFHANEYYESTIKDPNQVHPITAYICYHMKSDQYWKKISDASIKEMEVKAANALLLQELDEKPRIHRIVAPELLFRASPFQLSAGMQADVSNIQIRN